MRHVLLAVLVAVCAASSLGCCFPAAKQAPPIAVHKVEAAPAAPAPVPAAFPAPANAAPSAPAKIGDAEQAPVPEAAPSSADQAKAERKAKRRADFKAGVDARNMAAVLAHEKEVARLTANHQAVVAEYRAAKDQFDKALPPYQRAKDEYDAAKKLAAAVPPPGASASLLDVYRRKQKEVVDQHPGTEAAEDARRYLKNGSFPVRKIPPQPVRPAQPAGPSALKLPPLVLLPLDYPPDPEEVAEAEAAAQRRAQAAEAARKAADELDFDGLVLLRSSLKGSLGQFSGEITGTVVNRRGRELRYAQITFNLYDDSGAQVGTALANINNLESGGKWNFRAVTLNDRWKTYRCTGVTGR